MRKSLSVSTSILALLIGAHQSFAGGWTKSQFTTAKGEAVDQYICMPESKGPNPAVVIIHGAEPRQANYDEYERICSDLAAQGYVADFIEFYGPNEEVAPAETDKIRAGFFPWNKKIREGIEALDKNPAVDPKRVGEIGYSLGALLAMEHASFDPNQVAAVVEYYGPLPKGLEDRVATMPPVLIIHGGRDQIVNAKQAHAIDEMLTAANRPHELKIYPAARHGFNYPSSSDYDQPDTQAAWNASLEFLGKYLAPAGASH